MKKFANSFNGYDKREVNNFINEITINYSNLLNSLKERDAQIEDLKQKLEYFEKIESTLNKAVFVAEDASLQIKKVAREESESLVENAKKNASRIINNALLKAEKTEEEAEQLKRKVEVYKRRLKSLIEEQLNIIDDIDSIEL